MKLFQQLLVAPAALGLIAPVAATAAELNMNDVSSYSDSVGEVESISQFSDVYPTDWAFQALTDLAERHNCPAAMPAGSMTRYEAAALLDKCLGNVAQVNQEERRLLGEFAPELAVIKGRLDGLEARIGEFEAGQFSTTTKMNGKTVFNIGAQNRETELPRGNFESTTFTYVTQFNLNTSFTGDDLLYTRIKQGNGGNTPWEDVDLGTHLSASHNSNALTIDKLWYQFPIGDNFQAWVGPRIENYYMLASAPSIYKPVMKQFALGGNGAAYGSSTDGGFGLAWTQTVDDPSDPRFEISTNYTSKGASSANNDGGGMLGDNQAKWLTKFGYGAPRWQVSVAVAEHYCNEQDGTESCKDWFEYYGTTMGRESTGNSTSYALRAYWLPEETGAIPAIQLGYDMRNVDDDGLNGSVEETAQWMLGFIWSDAFVDGNRAGIAFGAPQHATDTVGGAKDPAGEAFTWEAYYDFKVSDNITVTPVIFGSTDRQNANANTDSDDIFGGLVQTTFKF